MSAIHAPEIIAVPGGYEHLLAPMTYGAFLGSLEGDEAFRERFVTALREVPFEAYKWETPPVDADSLDQPFRFVVLDSPPLARSAPDPAAFSRQLRAAAKRSQTVADFANLGGDAHLVAPCPGEDAPEYYPHLAAFTERAPLDEQHALWRRVAEVTRAVIAQRRTWLSTAGLGVPWLHVRLDTRPKYYGHAPYRRL